MRTLILTRKCSKCRSKIYWAHTHRCTIEVPGPEGLCDQCMAHVRDQNGEPDEPCTYSGLKHCVRIPPKVFARLHETFVSGKWDPDTLSRLVEELVVA